MPKTLTVHIVCEQGHEQDIKLQNVDRQFAEGFAGLIDGTSPMYVYPPDEKSSIGKCGICRSKVKATLVE